MLPLLVAVVVVVALSIGLATSLVSHSPRLVMLGVLGIMLSAVTVVRPVFGLMVLLLAMLFAPGVSSVNPSGERTATIAGADITIVLVVLGWVIHQARQREGMFLRWTPINLPVFAMTGVIIMATLIGVLMGTDKPRTGFFFALKRIEYFVIFFMVTTLLRSWKQVRIALLLFMLSCFVINVLAVGQQILIPNSDLVRGGVTGTFGPARANVLGGFYLIVISVTLGLMTYVESNRLRLLLIAQFIISVVSLAFTHSRGAFVSLPFAILAMLFVDRSRRLIQISGIGLLTLIGVLLFVWLSFGGERSSFLRSQKRIMESQVKSIAAVATKGTAGDPSWRARVRSWQGSIPVIARYPFLGQGVGSRPLSYSDNHYFQEMLDTGIIGLTVFLWLNLWIFLAVRELHHKSEGVLKGAAAGFIGGHVGLLFHAVTCASFYTIGTMQPFWFLLGLLMTMYIAQDESPQTEPSPRAQYAPQVTAT